MENFQDKLTETYVLYVVDSEPIDTTDLVSVLSGGNLGIEWIDKHFTLIDYNENEILFKTEIFNELLFYLNDMIEQFLFDDGSFYDFS
ncbi:hypothetical protein CL176_05725 [Suicoccus acidiformans]|uniref:Uncharacterized protein n=1 Tax=Suicoccus acidiformans TaxID=2036206 RepID=A0A347WKC4_9LACT|nr:hypothetical protein [Suicoccus acidiformans]AXY25531.1 hypothetical protein CL176_05725 [Suicoccus acidiformans]